MNKRCEYHRYVRRNNGTKTRPYLVFACQDCPNYIRADLLVGRKARCCYCGEGFRIPNKMKYAKFVHCENCTRGRKSAESAAIQELLKKLEIEETVNE